MTETERALAWCGNSVYHDECDPGVYDDRCGACRRMFERLSTHHLEAGGTLQTALRQQWQPISTAPKDGTDLLMWEPSLGHCVIAHSVNGEWPWFYKPTHWMPLPDPPALLPALEPTP